MLGLDPKVATNDFRIVSFPMKADGTPDLAGIVFDPPQGRWNVPGARAVFKGAATLDGRGERWMCRWAAASARPPYQCGSSRWRWCCHNGRNKLRPSRASGA